ncbi:MAG: hypothetical protein D6828_03740, partial [Nitrospirae bacterium]
MKKGDNRKVFSILDQKGPFAIGDEVPTFNTLSCPTKYWIKMLDNYTMTTKYRAIRNQVFEILNINRFSDIYRLINNRSEIEAVSSRAYTLLGNMFGIEGTKKEIINKIDGYAQVADD